MCSFCFLTLTDISYFSPPFLGGGYLLRVLTVSPGASLEGRFEIASHRSVFFYHQDFKNRTPVEVSKICRTQVNLFSLRVGEFFFGVTSL